MKLKGDGIAVKKGNLKLRGLGPMMSSGLEVPDLKIGDLVVDVGFNKGVAEIEELSNKQSGNLFVDMGGKVTLRRNIGRSRLDLCFKVKGEPRFLAREKKIQSLLELASVQLKRDAKGFLTIPLKGTFTRIRPPRGVCKIK